MDSDEEEELAYYNGFDERNQETFGEEEAELIQSSEMGAKKAAAVLSTKWSASRKCVEEQPAQVGFVCFSEQSSAPR